MGYAWLNLGSLALGGIAWALPVAALARRDKATRREAAVCSAASAASCSLALCLVVFYLGHLADSRALAGHPWRRGGAGAHETA